MYKGYLEMIYLFKQRQRQTLRRNVLFILKCVLCRICSIMSTWLNNCVPKCFQHLVMKSSHSPSVFSVNNLANAQTLSSFVKCQSILGWILHLCILVCFLPDSFFIEIKKNMLTNVDVSCHAALHALHFTCSLHNVLMNYPYLLPS